MDSIGSVMSEAMEIAEEQTQYFTLAYDCLTGEWLVRLICGDAEAAGATPEAALRKAVEEYHEFHGE